MAFAGQILRGFPAPASRAMGAAVQECGEWDFRYEPSAPAQLCDDLRRRLGNYAGGDACSEGYDHRNHTPGSETPGPVMGHCQVDSHQATQAENQESDAPRDSENHQRDARLIRQERSRALEAPRCRRRSKSSARSYVRDKRASSSASSAPNTRISSWYELDFKRSVEASRAWKRGEFLVEARNRNELEPRALEAKSDVPRCLPAGKEFIDSGLASGAESNSLPGALPQGRDSRRARGCAGGCLDGHARAAPGQRA